MKRLSHRGHRQRSGCKQETIEIVLHDASLLGLRLKPNYAELSSRQASHGTSSQQGPRTPSKTLLSINIVEVEDRSKERNGSRNRNDVLKRNLEVGDKLSHIDDIPIRYFKYSESIQFIRSKRPIKLTFLKKASKEGFVFVNQNDSDLTSKKKQQKERKKKKQDEAENTTGDDLASEENVSGSESDAGSDLSTISLDESVTKKDLQNVESDVEVEDKVKVIVDMYEDAIELEDLSRLRDLCFFHGIPEATVYSPMGQAEEGEEGEEGAKEALRSVCWKILLGYLNIKEQEQWHSKIEKDIEAYKLYTVDFLGFASTAEPSSMARTTEASTDTGASRRPVFLNGQGWWEMEPYMSPSVPAKAAEVTATVESDQTIEAPQKQEKEATSEEPPASTLDSPQKAVAEDVAEEEAFQEESGEAKTDTTVTSQKGSPDPLAEKKASQAQKRFVEAKQDKELREQIWKDVQRTCPGLQYFTEETCAGLERILFIYAKLHSGIYYVQGMNEILAPLAYVLDIKGSIENEAQCFFCFCLVMGQMKDVYLHQSAALTASTETEQQGEGEPRKTDEDAVDACNSIEEKMNAIMLLLYRHDYFLFRKLNKEIKIEPWYYAFRWITTLLGREFEFPDRIRLWDSLFSNQFSFKNQFDYLLYICCAMLLLQKNQLIEADFATALQILQHYPTVDVQNLVHLATRLYKKDKMDGITLDTYKEKRYMDLHLNSLSELDDGSVNILRDFDEVSVKVSQNMKELAKWFKQAMK